MGFTIIISNKRRRRRRHREDEEILRQFNSGMVSDRTRRIVRGYRDGFMDYLRELNKVPFEELPCGFQDTNTRLSDYYTLFADVLNNK